MTTKTVKDAWIVQETTELWQLIIEEGGSIAAPEGKMLTLSVNGVSAEAEPGTYTGEIVLTVSDPFMMPPSGLMRFSEKWTEFRSAIVIEDNKYCEKRSVPAVVKGGSVTGTRVEDVRIFGTDQDFSGIIVTGNSDVTIDDVRIEFEGQGDNDFIAVGAGITGIGDSRVTVNNADIHINGVTRCAVHAGGNSIITINDSTLVNESPTGSKIVGSPNWCMGNYGTNRSNQTCDSATVYYNNCFMRSNGWGIVSVDGSVHNRLYFKGCTMELTGPRSRGYGVFAIGDCFASFEDCDVTVSGQALLIKTEEHTGGRFSNCLINSFENAAQFFRDRNGTLTVDRGSVLNTDLSTFLVKGSASTINVDDSVLNPKNGVILQLMDNDDPGMGPKEFDIPVGQVDTPDPERDLVNPDEAKDIFMNLSNMTVFGDFYNSTTNLEANCKGEQAPLPPGIPPEEWEDMAEDLQASHNMVINMRNVQAESVISSATQKYRDGLKQLNKELYFEIGMVTQTAAPTVNNGVIVSLDGDSVWTVRETSYITSLTLAEGAVVQAPAGKTLTMTVDGKATAVGAGEYAGKIVLEVK